MWLKSHGGLGNLATPEFQIMPDKKKKGVTTIKRVVRTSSRFFPSWIVQYTDDDVLFFVYVKNVSYAYTIHSLQHYNTSTIRITTLTIRTPIRSSAYPLISHKHDVSPDPYASSRISSADPLQ